MPFFALTYMGGSLGPGMEFVEVTIKVPAPVLIERMVVFLVLLYRRVRYGYRFRRIKLTRGKYAIVDVEDFERLNQYKWQVRLTIDGRRESFGYYADEVEAAKAYDRVAKEAQNNNLPILTYSSHRLGSIW